MSTARRRPTLFAVALTLAAVGIFVRLGLWQLHRADEKKALVAQYEAGQRSTVDLSGAGSITRYQKVRARGRYDAGHQVLLDNMPSAMGGAGYRVLTPFELEQGGWWLVDRGWVAPGRTRADLPGIDVRGEVRTIHGQTDRLPEPGVRLASAPASGGERWPRVMNFPDRSTLERELGRPIAPLIVKLDASEPDGYERVWREPVVAGSGRHLGYAVQWFAFAATAVILFFIVSFRTKRP
jgi:surfeit locus 1 family protein